MDSNVYLDKLISKGKQAGFKWNDTIIILESKTSAKFFYLATQTTQTKLYVNGILTLETGGFNLWSRAVGEFVDSLNNNHQIEYEEGGIFSTWLPCTVSIDGEKVYNGGIPVKGILKGLFAFSMLLVVFLFFLDRML